MALFSGKISDQPFADGLGNLMQAFIASQDIYGQRQTADAKRQLLGVQTDLERQKLAREKLASDEALRKQVMGKEFFGKMAAADRQAQPDYVGPPDPNLQAPSPYEALEAGLDPEKLAQAFSLTKFMNPNSTANDYRVGLAAQGKPAGNNEGVTSGEVAAAQKNELDKARAQAGATVQAAQIRGPAQGAAPSFKPVETRDGVMILDERSGQFQPMLDPATGKPVMGKAGGGKPLSSSGDKQLSSMGDQMNRFLSLSETFDPSFAGQPMTGDFNNLRGRLGKFAGFDIGSQYADQAQWWQDMQDMEGMVRHDRFGSALTATEAKDWLKITVTPDMAPEQIKANLARRQAIVDGAISRRVNAYKAAGYNQDQIEALVARTPTSAPQTPTPANPAVTVRMAREAITAGKDPQAVADMLRQMGIDPKQAGL